MTARIRAALASTASWPRMKRAMRALSDAELAEAEQIERLGQRRENLLMALKGERQRRQGRADKMLSLRSEVTR